MLMLEGMQAGLSWVTILNKMDALCVAFDNFDPNVLKDYDKQREQELMRNPSIIRNRLKIRAAKTTALAYFRVCEEFGSF